MTKLATLLILTAGLFSNTIVYSNSILERISVRLLCSFNKDVPYKTGDLSKVAQRDFVLDIDIHNSGSMIGNVNSNANWLTRKFNIKNLLKGYSQATSYVLGDGKILRDGETPNFTMYINRHSLKFSILSPKENSKNLFARKISIDKFIGKCALSKDKPKI